jgi:hypothetical protein
MTSWSVDHQPIRGERDGSADEGEGAAYPRSPIQGRLKAGVAVGFQECGEYQNEERTTTVRDDVIQ